MARSVAEMKADMAKLLKEMAAAANEDAADPATTTNPYAAFRLPAAVRNNEPDGPVYNQAEVDVAVDEGLDALNDGDFFEFAKDFLGFAIGALT